MLIVGLAGCNDEANHFSLSIEEIWAMNCSNKETHTYYQLTVVI
jgi:hypothetical protein